MKTVSFLAFLIVFIGPAMAANTFDASMSVSVSARRSLWYSVALLVSNPLKHHSWFLQISDADLINSKETSVPDKTQEIPVDNDNKREIAHNEGWSEREQDSDRELSE